MTIMATHFAIVLGAWRLRVRIDLDEPRGEVADSATLADDRPATAHAQERTRAAAVSSPTPRWN